MILIETQWEILKKAEQQAKEAQEKNKVTKFVEDLAKYFQEMLFQGVTQEKRKEAREYIKEHIPKEYIEKILKGKGNTDEERISWLIRQFVEYDASSKESEKQQLINLFLSKDN
ncbi:MAG: hypothetical protein AAB732_02550 [Patescibacteria group bacterium]